MISFYMKHKLKMYMNNNYIQKIVNINTEAYYPYIAFNYNVFTFDINEDVIINYYCTDYWQSEINGESTNIQFTLEYNINGIENRQIVNIGDNVLNIGKVTKGDYWYTLRVYDLQGNSSHSIYGEFRVIDKVAYDADIASKTTMITSDILAEYGITTGDYTERTVDNESITHATKLGLQKLFYDYAENYRKIILPQDTTYTIDVEGKWVPGVAVQYYKDILTIPSNFTIDFNGGELKQLVSTPDQKVGYMFAINDCYDSHIINATFTGDYGSREFISLEGLNYIAGEQCGCGIISGLSKYCSIEDCRIQWFPGYVLSAGIQQVGVLADNYTEDDGLHGETLQFTPSEKGQYITQLLALDGYIDFGSFRLGQWLGFLYEPYGDDVLIKIHWFNKNKEFIKTTIEHQFRDIKIIDGARYVQAEYTFDKFSSVPTQAMVYRHNIPRNCIIKNVDFNDTRTCALNPNQANAFVIDGCTFARCATNITPVAIDFEDGWHNMQDYVLRNCEILEPVGTADIVIVGGFNLILENNKNWRVYSRNGFTRGQVYRNNEDLSGVIGLTTHRMSAYCRVDNNVISAKSSFTNGLGDLQDFKLYITNCTYPNNVTAPKDKNTIYRDCVFKYDKSPLQFRGGILGGHTYVRCEFIDYQCTNGHLGDFIVSDSTLTNIQVEACQGTITMNNCKINTFITANYVYDINIEITDSTITDFQFNRIAYADKANYNIRLINCTIENTIRKNIIDDGWIYGVADGKSFNVYVENCTFVNGTVIANDILNNSDVNIVVK